MESKMTIEYPANLPDILQATRSQFEQEARMAMAVKLFEMKRISSGIAAAIAGIDRRKRSSGFLTFVRNEKSLNG